VRLSTIEPTGAPGSTVLIGVALVDRESTVADFWSVGESGEKEGNDVSDLSDAAMEEAELDGWETRRRVLR